MVNVGLSAERDHLVLDPAWNETELLKITPGARFASKTKTWTMPLEYGSLVTLRGLFTTQLVMHDDVIKWAWDERQRRVDPAMALRLRTTTTDDDPIIDERLYPFQRLGVHFMLVASSGLLGDDMGCGKTIQTLSYFDQLGKFPALVICPNGVKHHWATRIRTWLPGATPYVVEGGAAAGRKILNQAKDDPLAIVIINYESVRIFSRLAPYGSVRLKRCKECDPKFGDDIKATQCHVHCKELNGFGFRVVIMDEAHRIGSPDSQQTRASWSVAHDPSVEHRWALTGTPDNLERLWAIMHAVAPHEYPTKTLFMERYALRSWNAYGGLDVVGIRPDTRDELNRILDPRFRRMVIDVVLPQLPPVIRETRTSELTPAMRRQYAELHDKLWTRLEDGTLFLTANKMVARTRELQFAAGTVIVEKPDEDDVTSWQVTITNPSPKLDTFEEVLEELGDHTQFVVACLHRDVVNLAAERLANRNVSHAIIVGGVHPSVAQQATEDLKTGKIRAIVFTVDAGGEGLDMSGASVMIRLQRSWSLVKTVQSERRNRRIGAEVHDCLRIIDIVTRDTREEYQNERLQQKLEMMEEITRDRAQLQQRLVDLAQAGQVATVEFTQAVQDLDQLNQVQQEMFTTDDVDPEDA